MENKPPKILSHLTKFEKELSEIELEFEESDYSDFDIDEYIRELQLKGPGNTTVAKDLKQQIESLEKILGLLEETGILIKEEKIIDEKTLSKDSKKELNHILKNHRFKGW